VERILKVPLGVVIAKETVVSPWQDHIWRPLSVFLDAEPVTAWRPLQSGPGYEHFHAATMDLELHRKETPGYIANLGGDDPGIYVILRQGSGDGHGEAPMHVHLLTASAHDVEAYGHTGEEIIGRVAMPEPLRELLEAFIAAHHEEEVFKKRQRKPHVQEEEHQFGQEPIQVLRERMKRSGKDEAKS
jgi:hypothetical protein